MSFCCKCSAPSEPTARTRFKERFMKRFLIAFTILLGFGSIAEAKKLNVVTTTQDLASITREIGGNRVEVSSIAKGYQDPHFVEAKPSFLLKLRKAEMLVVVGLELEIAWLPPLIDQSRNANIRPGGKGFLDVSQGVEILDRPSGAVNRSMGDIHAMGNPHYWLEPGNAIRVAIQVQRKLAQLQPGDAAYFAKNLDAFKKKLNDGNKRWTAMLA